MRPRLPSPVWDVADAWLAERGVELRLKRDDLIHPLVPKSKPTGGNRVGQVF
ncbi:hypothetical protein ACFYOY_23775 [Streptomyces sp. NPDC007875]|uniref:hypothetical protein n=1 Tax=Streptomyces sp. NPDC007875 TaxID=3364783 RepID=UPI00367C5E18